MQHVYPGRIERGRQTGVAVKAPEKQGVKKRAARTSNLKVEKDAWTESAGLKFGGRSPSSR
ncbi:hypothetical protein [Desulfitobacterium hafniense]|uniref:hypothetical protein n=1 Tax=Desulfitobacterium hafniense TaxID=49338 RepID=UPI001A9A56D7|nr:hypothetical protein [Desulfitobacterium hafniense]